MALITAQEVNTLAFVNQLDPALILPQFIESAQTRYIVPAVTREVMDLIAATPGDYTTLVDDFIKPYLAFSVKYMFYNQLLTETQTFAISDEQRMAAISEILEICSIKRALLLDYLNENIFETPEVSSVKSIAGIRLNSNPLINTTSTTADNADVATQVIASSTGSLSDDDTLPFIKSAASLLNKITWSNVKTLIRTYLSNFFSPKDHTHEELAISASDELLQLDLTDNELSVTPYSAPVTPAPDYPYFRAYNINYPLPNAASAHDLILEGRLLASQLRAFTQSPNVPAIYALSGIYNSPAGEFSGGVKMRSSILDVLTLQYYLGGDSGSSAVLLRINRDISGTVSLNQPIIYITDDPASPNVTGELLKATVDTVLRVVFNPRVEDGNSAVAYMLDTRNDLQNAGAKLLSVRNQGTEKASVSASGIGSFAGVSTSEDLEITRGKYVCHRQVLGTDTDGDWRSYSDASGFYFQLRQSGSWVTKHTISV